MALPFSGIICVEHKESIEGEGLGALLALRTFDLPEAEDELRFLFKKYYHPDGPYESLLYDRAAALISVFIERHQECKLSKWQEDSGSDELWWYMNEDPDWTSYWVWEDGKAVALSGLAGIESDRSKLTQHRSDLQKVQSKLDMAENRRFQKKRIAKLTRKRESLMKAIERIQKRVDERDEASMRRRVDEPDPGLDLIARLRSDPLRRFEWKTKPSFWDRFRRPPTKTT
jgi:hypothetical protein